MPLVYVTYVVLQVSGLRVLSLALAYDAARVSRKSNPGRSLRSGRAALAANGTGARADHVPVSRRGSRRYGQPAEPAECSLLAYSLRFGQACEPQGSRCRVTVRQERRSHEPAGQGLRVVGCRDQVTERRLGSRCPRRGRRGHGSWYLSVEIPAGLDGRRHRG
jgi:hypothetical protein